MMNRDYELLIIIFKKNNKRAKIIPKNQFQRPFAVQTFDHSIIMSCDQGEQEFEFVHAGILTTIKLYKITENYKNKEQ